MSLAGIIKNQVFKPEQPIHIYYFLSSRKFHNNCNLNITVFVVKLKSAKYSGKKIISQLTNQG
jgi:oligoribonuclease NrnB/cAMP/cGMP phosphodiesterase (DHH superfamily)